MAVEALHINRSSLLRKVKNITNLSVVDFIRLIRLKKAARMLQDGKHKINEVCYAVGITSRRISAGCSTNSSACVRATSKRCTSPKNRRPTAETP